VQNTSTNPVPVSGTVGIDPANNGVAVTNFPANQTVNGTVNVGNLPASQTVKGTVGIDPQQNAVTSGDQTQVLLDKDYTIAPSGNADLGRFPVTAFRQIRLIVETDGSTQLVSIGEPVGARSVQFDVFNADGHGQTRTYDTPGVEFEINVLGPPGASGSMMLAGRNN
jgi:hypothetical protein